MLASDSLWYKDAILYELRVGSFQDSNADGIGDFRGLLQRLDYLADLGVTALWLLPFYPSPMRDDGYDIADYQNVHPDFGTLEDFKAFLKAAHQRGLRVVTELVINHTSDQHPWFQRARKSPPGSRYRNFYVWSDTPERYAEARIIFKDFERSNWSWDPVAKAYYWHRFYSHQPDLNFDNPEVRRAVLRTVDFWMRLGVDGMRLDAVPYLFEREGTICENLPETHEFLRELRAHVDARYRDRMLLAEANQWPEDAAAYFGNGDECHMAFHFPIMPRLFMALHMEDRFPIIDIMQQTPPIPENCQWALFLRNHDELTLEMVTDEERDYMYRVYAQDAQARINLGIRRRLAPLLGKDRRRIELMNALLFSLPGTPVIYYGDEIGMGDNVFLGDRNGVRTPMQWSADRNAGFSRANPQRLHLPVIVDPEFHYESVNVEAQQSNPHSLLWWMKRVIALRKRYRAFGRGSLRFLPADNRKVVAFVREYEGEQILVVANLSRFVQPVELSLGEYRDRELIELFGRTRFPRIDEGPYRITLGPHAFYWFSLEKREQAIEAASVARAVPTITVRGSWTIVFRDFARQQLERAVVDFLPLQSWFRRKTDRILRAVIEDVVELSDEKQPLVLVLVRVERGAAEKEWCVLVLRFVVSEAEAVKHPPERVLAHLRCEEQGAAVSGELVECADELAAGLALVEALTRRRPIRGERGQILLLHTRAFRQLVAEGSQIFPVAVHQPQWNPGFVAGGRLRVKLYREPFVGLHPEVEIGQKLLDVAQKLRVPTLAAFMEYRQNATQTLTLCAAHEYIPHEGDLWSYTVDHLKQYFERVLAEYASRAPVQIPPASWTQLVPQSTPPLVNELCGPYLQTARLLGTRVAELHRALASLADDPEFAPEPLTSLYQRSLYQGLRNLWGRIAVLLQEKMEELPVAVRQSAQHLLYAGEAVLQIAQRAIGERTAGMRIRVHGDLHLGRVLHTGKDVYIVGFAGDPTRSALETRIKRTPLRDMASMLRSLEFAVDRILYGPAAAGWFRPEDIPVLEPWGHLWERWVGAALLRSYLEGMGGSKVLPDSADVLERLLTASLIERSLLALEEELRFRPDHAGIPIRGLLELVENGRGAD
ncbi:MAG: maltose alpha-D-glucosyltransferase [Candidatus Binatia bacterium]|nr:maltose alpha-D-glucosyltransferase [Candidatus Binatia bacterium]